MILALSTSSAIASIALFDDEGNLLFARSKESQLQASGACFEMLRESGIDPMRCQLFLADIGPGSFTGTRVAVTIAKSLAFAAGGQCAGSTAFDLISPSQVVVFPSKKGEWFIRRPQQEVQRSPILPDEPYVGFGPGLDSNRYPLAERFGPLLERLVPQNPMTFVPEYLIDPSISTQKKGLGLSGGAHR